MDSRLPVEVITHIMKYLSVADIKEASLVSRAWYEASLDPVLQKDVKVLLTQAGSRPMTSLQRRKTPHLILNDVDGSFLSSSKTLSTFIDIGDGVRTLSLKASSVTEKTFMNLIACCPALVDLDLTACNSLFMSGKLLECPEDQQRLKAVLQKLSSLNLSGIRFLSDMLLTRLVSVCENLEKLSVASCQIIFNISTYYPVNRSSLKESSAIFTFLSILKLLKSRPKRIKSLNFSRTSFDDDALRLLSNVEELHLEELHLVSCKEVSDEGISALCKTQVGLKLLDVAFCTGVTDASLQSITKSCPVMEKLCLDSCKQITGRSVKGVHAMSALVSLNLSGCYQVLSAGILEGLSTRKLPHLKSLNLNSCSAISDKCVVSICNLQPQLESLDLGSCFHITNVSVQSISKHMNMLRHLRLAFCKLIDSFGILGFVEDCKGQNVHDDSHPVNCRCTRHDGDIPVFSDPLAEIKKTPKKLTVEEVNSLAKDMDGPVYSLSAIKGMRSLDLKGCLKLTNSAIIHTVRFTELQSLDLSMCFDVDDDCLLSLATNNPSLQDLSLAKCLLITDVGVVYIASNLHRLSSLNISCCDGITDKGLQSLLKCQHLKKLDVSMCACVSVQCVELLEHKLPNLHQIKRQYVGSSLVKDNYPM